MPLSCPMPSSALLNRQLGRNVQLLIDALAEMPTPEERFPYLRSLVAHIEDVRPEWAHAPGKAEMMAHLVTQLGGAVIDPEEIRVALAARAADAALAAETFEVAAVVEADEAAPDAAEAAPEPSDEASDPA